MGLTKCADQIHRDGVLHVHHDRRDRHVHPLSLHVHHGHDHRDHLFLHVQQGHDQRDHLFFNFHNMG